MPTRCYLSQFVLLCFHAQGPTNLHDTQRYSTKHKSTPPRVRKTLGRWLLQTSRNLRVVFTLLFKGHKRTVL